MKPRTVAILAAVVAALAAFVFFFERELPSTDERRERAGRALALEPVQVTALELAWGDRRVRFERDAAPDGAEAAGAARDWRLVEPIRGRADGARLEQLLSTLAALEVVRPLEGAARADLGLEPPRGAVRWTAGGRDGSLEVGGEVPASSNVAIASGDRAEPLIVPRAFTTELERAPAEWRARDVIGIERGEIERIRLLGAGGEIALARRGESFAVEHPFADAADRDAVDPLLAEVTGLSAERFVEAPVPAEVEAALAAGPGTIELAVAGRAEPLRIELGGEVSPELDERWARVEGLVFATRGRLADSLAIAAADWRSKSWTSFESWRIERIRIEDAQGRLELVREGGEWKLGGEIVPYGEASDLLFAITSARATSVVPPEEAARFPAAKPTLTVGVGDAQGGEETLTLHGAAGAAGSIAARVSGRAVVLVLPAAIGDELAAKVAAVRAAATPAAGTGEAGGPPAAEDPAG